MSAQKETLENMLDKDTLKKLEDRLEKMVEKHFENAKSTANDAKDKVIEYFNQTQQKTEKAVSNNPFKSLGASLLAGVFLGWLLSK
ncbi:MAG: hypothetical protein KIT27_01990 [Legionellales bacterium]|nr:hypothetical protein [Legionellales bacterium]